MEDVLNIIRNTEFEGIENMAYVIGRLDEIEDNGIYDGVEYLLVKVKNIKEEASIKESYIILPNCEKSFEKVTKKELVFAKGELIATFSFNSNAKKHVFIKPELVKTLPDNFEIEQLKDFYLDYTKYNRVILDCQVFTDLFEKVSTKNNKKFKNFKLLFNGDTGSNRTLKAIIWDSADCISNIQKGDKIKVIGSLYIRRFDPEDPGSIHYTIYVQRILRNDIDTENVVENLFK